MRNEAAGGWSTRVFFSSESCNLYLFYSGVLYIYRSVDYCEYIQSRINHPRHVCTLFSPSKEITHCWSPDLPGSLEAMITQVLSTGKHLVSSLYRAYTFVQRTGRQKCVSTRERNYDWAPARPLRVTAGTDRARTNSIRTRVLSVKGRAAGSTEEALNLGENKECGWNPILGTTYHYTE